ncbi:MAG: ester cyclase [Carbonactinosporaceae bacterium]
MGQAREVMDRLTEAIFKKDLDTAASLYASDAVAVTPDQGELNGREQIVEYLRGFVDACPDAAYESIQQHESGNVAIDEGYLVGTNTAPLRLPTGDNLPATGRSLRVRGCDLAVVENGVVTRHRFYFDQMELLGQLGLLEQPPG